MRSFFYAVALLMVQILGSHFKRISSIGTNRSGICVLFCLNFDNTVRGNVVPSFRHVIAYFSIDGIELL